MAEWLIKSVAGDNARLLIANGNTAGPISLLASLKEPQRNGVPYEQYKLLFLSVQALKT
jgi:hypothetical protein